MAWSHVNRRGDTYYLHAKQVTLRGGRAQTIYFFAREVRQADALDDLPIGYVVVDNERTGLPILKKTL